MKNVIYLRPSENFTSHQHDAPLVAVKRGELGFWPIYSRADPKDLNHGGVTEAIAVSAASASMFGWHCPAAKEANEYFESLTNND